MSSSYTVDKKLSSGQTWGSGVRQGCALARSTGQKQGVGQESKVSELHRWFSDFASGLGRLSLLAGASTLWESVWCLMEPECHGPSWVFLGQQDCFGKESDNRYFRTLGFVVSVPVLLCDYKAAVDGT